MGCVPVVRAVTRIKFGVFIMDTQNVCGEFARGSLVLRAGSTGPLWRVMRGAVVLQTILSSGTQVVQVAVAGDLLGTEALAGWAYRLEARALTACQLQVVDCQSEHDQALLLREAMLQQHHRALDMAELRTGSVSGRLLHALQLLGHEGFERGLEAAAQVRRALPMLGDLARLIDAKKETVCRALVDILPRPRGVAGRRAVRSGGSLMGNMATAI